MHRAASIVGLGAWYIDLHSEEIHLSEEARALYGINENGPYPSILSWERYAPEHRPCLQEAYRACIDEGRAYDMELEAFVRGGERRWLRATGEPVYDAEGRIVAARGALLDIHAYKQREAELAEARDAAERTDRAKSEFLSAMSHELRTPLNAILGLAQLLSADDEPGAETRREYLRHILSAGWHLRDLVGDILDLARIEAGKTSLTLEPIRVDELLEECFRLVREQAAERGVTLRIAPPQGKGGLHVQADRVRAKQVLLNVLTNAVKYNYTGGSVTVHYGLEAGTVLIDIVDTGSGIAPKQRSALFDAFERLGRERGQIEGVGIGLALALRLARLMHGELWLVDSVPEQGSRFRLSLPCAEGEGYDRHREPSLDPGLLDERADDPPLRVLAAEDNSVNMLLLSGLIARRQGVELIEASDGKTALELAEHYGPDLFLLDIHLPDTDGFDLVRQLRSMPSLAGKPMVALSADATDELRQRALREGFDDYIVKPFELEQLDALIREARLGKAE